MRPSALGFDWRTAIIKERAGGIAYSLYAHGTDSTNLPMSEITIGGARTVAGTSTLPIGVWTHLATTYDGANQRFFVNGVQVASRAQTGAITTSTSPLRIGGNSIWGEFFAGQIDEVRIYDRALTAAEIQGDMNQPVGVADTEAPTAPSNLTATGSLANAQLSWTASTDNVGVARYSVHRSTTSGFTPAEANRIAQPTGTTLTDTPSAGIYFYKVAAEDAMGNLSPASNQAEATVGDLVAPSAPGTLSAIGAIGRATLTWGAASDNVGVVRYGVHRSTTSGFTPQRGQPDRAAGGHVLHRQLTGRHLLLPRGRRGRRGQPRAGLERGDGDDHGRQPGADDPRQPRRQRLRDDREPDAGRRRRTTSASPATTSTARPSRASRPAAGNRIAPAHGPELLGHRPQRRDLLLQGHCRGWPGQPQRRRPTRRPRPSPSPRRPASSPPTASTRGAGPRRPTSPATATPARSATRCGRRSASSARRSSSTAATRAST